MQLIPLLLLATVTLQTPSPSPSPPPPPRALAVFLVPTAGPQWSSLLESLQIALADVARVRERRVEIAPEDEAALAAAAQALLTGSEPAEVALWMRPGADGWFALQALARSRASGPTELARAQSGLSADVDRTIALKARDGLERLLAPPARPVAPPSTIAKEPMLVKEPLRPVASVDAVWRVGVGAAAGTAVNGKVELGCGVGSSTPSLRWEATASFALASRSVLGAPRVETSEWGAGLQLAALGALGARYAAGAFVEVGGRWLTARSTLPDGRGGEAEALVPSVALGPEVRRSLGLGLEAIAAVGVDVAIRSQRFAIDGATVADLGRFRLQARLALGGRL